jgi:glycerol-3-phosphate dehydrogenase
MATFGVSGAPPYLRATNALVDRPARDIATVAAGPSGRMLTAVPWQGYVLVGTHQSAAPVDAGETPTPAVLEETVRAANAAFPRLQATVDEVRLLHHGLVPAAVRGGRADLLAEARVISHGSHGAPGLTSLVGVKFTSARVAARRAVDRIARDLGRSGRSRTDRAPLPHAGVADVEGRLVETARSLGLHLERDLLDHLTGWYGTEASDVLRHAAEHRQLGRIASTPVLEGEIDYAALRAQAVHLSDAVFRRTSLGAAGHPGAEAVTAAARIMAARLGWDPARTAEEIART